MRIRTFASLATSGRLFTLMKLTSLFKPFYRLSFLASATQCGLLSGLNQTSCNLEEIGTLIAPDFDPALTPSLLAWLDLGVELGILGQRQEQYYLKSLLARKLALLNHDDVAALAQEVAGLHHRLIMNVPQKLRRGESWTMEDQDGAIIARSSKIMSPFVFQLIDWALPRTPNLRLLEIGCGSGIYLKYAGQLNPSLSMLGIEYQAEVAALANANLDAELADRVSIRAMDIRDLPIDEQFDVITLYNVIYYFPITERLELLRKLKTHLRSGGRLILSSCCQGGSAGMHLLNVWSSSTQGCGPLPQPSDLYQLIEDAGFTKIKMKRMIPGEAYFAFIAENTTIA